MKTTQYQFQRGLRKIFLHYTDDVRNSPMRAGTQNRHFITLFQYQCQFIRKSISLFVPSRQSEEVFKMRIFFIRNSQPGKNKYAGRQFSDFIHKTETGAIQSVRMHHAVFTLLLELRNKKLFLADYFSLLIHLKKVMQTACMVTMSMRQYQEIHILQINPEHPGITYKKVGCPGIKQQTMPTRINKQGKPMLSL